MNQLINYQFKKNSDEDINSNPLLISSHFFINILNLTYYLVFLDPKLNDFSFFVTLLFII